MTNDIEKLRNFAEVSLIPAIRNRRALILRVCALADGNVAPGSVETLPEVTPEMLADLQSAEDVRLREGELAVIWRDNVPKIRAVLEAVAALRRAPHPQPENRGTAL